jgi:hypothetical protein
VKSTILVSIPSVSPISSPTAIMRHHRREDRLVFERLEIGRPSRIASQL